MNLQHDICLNLAQFLHQLLQVLLVGVTIGTLLWRCGKETHPRLNPAGK